MLVHNSADYRRVAWLLVAMGLVVAQDANPSLVV
ncbi:hypothetical protein Poly41_32360 [Novipirellula artificiosorum]|uniref:Uncharacterized protein n=1 Tax=Novipirellula artificiosorum TaxID=2528016 RepID=A0A5C6DQP7_9BACT|nr:hypothetical protein Poly41_32360 [Novipirellula artificiosorum]